MSIADEVRIIELERDALRAEAGYWRGQAKTHEHDARTLRSQLIQAGQKAVEDTGRWNFGFSYDGADLVSLDMNHVEGMLTGIFQSWCSRPGPLRIEIGPPKAPPTDAAGRSRQAEALPSNSFNQGSVSSE